jgi:hypothetical protein
MLLRSIPALLVGSALLLAPVAAMAADRGPSTPEERKQALKYIQDFEADPLNPSVTDEREWVLKWIIEVPDVHVNVCMIFDKLPKGNKKDSSTIFLAETLAQTAFVLQNPDKQGDLLAQYQAGVDGALRVYEILLKSNPKDRQPYFDDLIQKRDGGTLAEFVKERTASACKN